MSISLIQTKNLRPDSRYHHRAQFHREPDVQTYAKKQVLLLGDERLASKQGSLLVRALAHLIAKPFLGAYRAAIAAL